MLGGGIVEVFGWFCFDICRLDSKGVRLVGFVVNVFFVWFYEIMLLVNFCEIILLLMVWLLIGVLSLLLGLCSLFYVVIMVLCMMNVLWFGV